MKQTLKEFLQAKAIELKSDWNDVPEWVITTCQEYIDQPKPSVKDEVITSAARAIKAYLIELAVDDRLPLDMNELNVAELASAMSEFNPTAKELAVENASHYLYDDDGFSIDAQLELIASQAQTDGSGYIDDVEGVMVWEKVVYTFDCDEFLQLIGWPNEDLTN